MKIMKLDFVTPNRETVGWIDTYFQFHDDERVQRTAERIASNTYDSSYDGWDEQPESNVRRAFCEFLDAMERFDIIEDEINNQ
jgi:hypothetical protein